LFKYLEKEINISFRQKKPLTLLIIDIDFFKEYNDNYGHIKGDHCLKTVAQLLNSSLKRKSDFVARYGGDEFIIILPNTEKQGAIKIIEEIKKAMAFANIEHKYSQAGKRVTLSIGGHTTFGYKEYKPEILIKEADDSLYWIKNQGRNDYLVTADEKPNA
jgi:diguanylate cyclase (GGDEF)-like protein